MKKDKSRRLRPADKVNIVVSELYHQINIRSLTDLIEIMSQGNNKLRNYIKSNVIFGNGLNRDSKSFGFNDDDVVLLEKYPSLSVYSILTKCENESESTPFANTKMVIVPNGYDVSGLGNISMNIFTKKPIPASMLNQSHEVDLLVVSAFARNYMRDLIQAMFKICNIWYQAELSSDAAVDVNYDPEAELVDVPVLYDDADDAAVIVHQYQCNLFADEDMLYDVKASGGLVTCDWELSLVEQYLSEIFTKIKDEVDSYVSFDTLIINPLNPASSDYKQVLPSLSGAYARNDISGGVDQVYFTRNMMLNKDDNGNIVIDTIGIKAIMVYGLATYYGFEKYAVSIADNLIDQDEIDIFDDASDDIITSIIKATFRKWNSLI